jgi:hypothetical protein
VNELARPWPRWARPWVSAWPEAEPQRGQLLQQVSFSVQICDHVFSRSRKLAHQSLQSPDAAQLWVGYECVGDGGGGDSEHSGHESQQASFSTQIFDHGISEV